MVLEQFQLKPGMNTCSLKWLNLWHATIKYIQKENIVCSPHVLIEPRLERGLIIDVEENLYCFSLSVVYGDSRGFPKNSHLGGTDQVEALTENWF